MGKRAVLTTVNEGMNRRAINYLGEVNEKSARRLTPTFQIGSVVKRAIFASVVSEGRCGFALVNSAPARQSYGMSLKDA
jgi:hypothetical protein